MLTQSRKSFLRRHKKARRRAQQVAQKPKPPNLSKFYDSSEWKRVRYDALINANGNCQCCGAGPERGAILNVDHIKPLKKYPQLALSLENLQVLCARCNEGKGNRDQTDWRKPTIDIALDLVALSDLRERGLLN